MRPSPREVMAWFDSDVTEEALATHLAVLRRDPNWMVRDRREDSARTVRLLYYPHGVPFDVVFERTCGGWRVLSRPLLEDDSGG